MTNEDTALVERPASERFKVGAVKKTAAPSMTIAQRLEAELPKSAGEKVIIKHLSGRHYRANWFGPAPSDTGNNVVKAWRINQSRFLEVTESGKSLNIKDRTAVG